MLNLDLVITVDSMVAHLAGALGRPVWLLLQHEADWRWLRDRTDSPWYPTMRIFRQPRAGDWRAVHRGCSCGIAVRFYVKRVLPRPRTAGKGGGAIDTLGGGHSHEPQGVTHTVNPEIVVIGTSAGGLDALQKLTAGLPENFPASVFVVMHTHPSSPGMLANILERAGDMKVSYAEDEQPFEPGHIYLAPADRHLLVEQGILRVVRGPKENRHRPAIDPLFRSAAAHYGPRTIGVILTGFLNDGTSGLAAVKRCGGITVVQSPEDARVPDMPASALRHVTVDHCIPLPGIAPLLTQLVSTPLPEMNPQAPEEIRLEADIAAMRSGGMSTNDQLGTRSPLTCPDCGGVLWEMRDHEPLRYRCHVGHAMTAEVLVAEQQETVERAIWLAVKTLEESGALARKLASDAAEREDTFSRNLLAARAEEAANRAAALRQILLSKPREDGREFPEEERRRSSAPSAGAR